MTNIEQDKKYMLRCIQLALLGKGHVSPNPMVGAVIVHNNKIIGEGYHRKCGEAHAEVNAINSVKDPNLLKDSTLYVSLEPCSHWGKTPPCSKLIIEKEIPRVVVGIQDPFFEVSGRGIRMLRAAGISVNVGVLEEECYNLNRAFFTVQQKNRPYVILKWAQSADGFIDRCRNINSKEKPVLISNPINSVMVHKLRAESDAILVGTNTVLLDNPQLTVRKWDGEHPKRVFFDRNLKVSSDYALLDGSIPTYIFTEKEQCSKPNVNYITIPFDESFPSNLLVKLMEERCQSLLVEGGSQTLNLFLNANLWDEIRVETSQSLINEGVPAPNTRGLLTQVKQYGDSNVRYYINRD